MEAKVNKYGNSFSAEIEHNGKILPSLPNNESSETIVIDAADEFNTALSDHVNQVIKNNNYQLVCVKDSGAWCVHVRNLPMLIVQVYDLKDVPKEIAASLEVMLRHGFDKGLHFFYDINKGVIIHEVEKPVFDDPAEFTYSDVIEFADYIQKMQHNSRVKKVSEDIVGPDIVDMTTAEILDEWYRRKKGHIVQKP